MIGLCIMLGVIIFCLLIIVIFGIFGVGDSQKWFPWP